MKLKDKSQPVSTSPDGGRVTEQTEAAIPPDPNDRRAELTAEEEEAYLTYLESILHGISIELPIVIPLPAPKTTWVRAKVVDLGAAPFCPVVDEEWFMADESEQ